MSQAVSGPGAMSADLQPLARALILFGLVVTALGCALLALPKLSWLGRLPGDLLIQRGRFTLSIPLGTSLVLSLLVTAVLWLVKRFRS